MLRILLAKDLRRAWRNPLPWLINLIVPLAMTALIGLVFGGTFRQRSAGPHPVRRGGRGQIAAVRFSARIGESKPGRQIS